MSDNDEKTAGPEKSEKPEEKPEEQKDWKNFLRYTPGGMLRWLRMKAQGREMAVMGACMMCGRCCRQLNLSYKDKWLRKEKEFERLFLTHEEFMRFRVTGRTAEGLLIFECDKITEEGLCGDHEGRPALCREYPLPELVFTGGELLDHCGYELRETPSFKKALSKAEKSGGKRGAVTEGG